MMSKTQKVYTYEEVLKASLVYFKEDELAATTWINKYAMKLSPTEYLEATPDAMHRRMADEFGEVEKLYQVDENALGDSNKRFEAESFLSGYARTRKDLTSESIYELFKDFKYVIPQGSVMTSLGNPNMIASLSNCIVVPPTMDSYGGILQTDQELAQLFKRRCGAGVDISNLRPANSLVSNAAGSTTGAVSFMDRFSNTTREVAQNGRRGALMITMDIAHPDVEDFITIKQDLERITGANISVRLSDEFMRAVDNDTEYTHRFPIDSDEPTHTKTIRAKDLWETIVTCAHKTAEPGLIFWDRQHHYSTSSMYPGFKNDSTNPCSEIAMQGGDSCRLIAVNLFSFVENPFTDKAYFDTDKFYSVVYESQRLMDDLVDLELKAIDVIKDKIGNDSEPDAIKRVELDIWNLLQETGKKGRRTGLGFTALADCIAALGFKLDSDNSLQAVDDIMRTKLKAEFDSSVDMAVLRGKFEAFDPFYEDESDFVQMMKVEFPDLYTRMMQYGRRNISISTVAPTGSLSMLAQVSSGIEPVFMLAYNRRRKVNPETSNAEIAFVDAMGDSFEEFEVRHHRLKECMEITGETDMNKTPYAGSTAPEIDWLKRVEMQALVQKYTTHSISSTINLPEDVSIERVSEIYLESWRQGLKGITVYRAGSRSGILNAVDKKEDGELYTHTTFPKRPKTIEAKVVRFQNAYDKWMAVVGILDGRPYEIFTGKIDDTFSIPASIEEGFIIKNKDEEGNSRYDFEFKDKQGYKVLMEGLSRTFNKEYWNYAKLISGILRHGMPVPYVMNIIANLDMNDDYINTWKAGVGRALKQFVEDGTEAVDKKCPECGDPEGLVFEEGCLICKSCGNTKCG